MNTGREIEVREYVKTLGRDPGRVPFDQKFRIELPKFSYAEWNGIFHQTGPISLYSCLGTFPANIYSTKC